MQLHISFKMKSYVDATPLCSSQGNLCDRIVKSVNIRITVTLVYL